MRGKRIINAMLMAAVVLLIANILVAVRHLGTRPGQVYRWVCPQSGDELIYNPSVFQPSDVEVKTTANNVNNLIAHDTVAAMKRTHRWELVEPGRLTVWLPWNWLALIVDAPRPDPAALFDQWKKRMAEPRPPL